jgi:hypothetical protein
VLDKFLTELSDFQYRQGVFAKAHIWIIAEDEQYLAHIWHEKYSVPETKYLGRFACKKLSKMTGIPSAERHWKQAKRHKKGNKGKTSTEKMMMMSTISMADGYERSKLRSQEARKANTIWDDDDFSQLNNFCAKNLLAQPTKVTRIVRTWMEEWEKRVFTAAGDEKFAARLSAKYEGLKWYDEDEKRNMRTMDGDCVVLCKLTSAHQTRKQKGGMGWVYCVLGIYDNYDVDKTYAENDERGLKKKSYDFFEMTPEDHSDFYYMVRKWYEENPEVGVRICEKGEVESVGYLSDATDI